MDIDARNFILSLLETTHPDNIVNTHTQGCECVYCVCVDDYSQWVAFGEYTGDVKIHEDQQPYDTECNEDSHLTPEYSPRSMYITQMWHKYHPDTYLSPSTYADIDVLLDEYTIWPTDAMIGLREILGSNFCFRHYSVPLPIQDKHIPLRKQQFTRI